MQQLPRDRAEKNKVIDSEQYRVLRVFLFMNNLVICAAISLFIIRVKLVYWLDAFSISPFMMKRIALKLAEGWTDHQNLPILNYSLDFKVVQTMYSSLGFNPSMESSFCLLFFCNLWLIACLIWSHSLFVLLHSGIWAKKALACYWFKVWFGFDCS